MVGDTHSNSTVIAASRRTPAELGIRDWGFGICERDSYNPRVQTVSSAPTRIDLAGGTIDIWPLYLFHEGAATLNAAISLRAHVAIAERGDGRIELRSIDTDRRVSAEHWSALDGAGDLS